MYEHIELIEKKLKSVRKILKFPKVQINMSSPKSQAPKTMSPKVKEEKKPSEATGKHRNSIAIYLIKVVSNSKHNQN